MREISRTFLSLLEGRRAPLFSLLFLIHSLFILFSFFYRDPSPLSLPDSSLLYKSKDELCDCTVSVHFCISLPSCRFFVLSLSLSLSTSNAIFFFLFLTCFLLSLFLFSSLFFRCVALSFFLPPSQYTYFSIHCFTVALLYWPVHVVHPSLSFSHCASICIMIGCCSLLKPVYY